VYSAVVAWRLRGQAIYALQFEDRMFHILLPITAYAMLAVSACLTRWHVSEALFIVAAAALLLLFIGIHNAWDNVTYHVFMKSTDQRSTPDGPQ
jgi:ABC-type proline/glycine betaine transport system permease subunit